MMEKEPATVVDTYLGYWADDVLVSYLIVDFGGVIMGIGGNLLNSADSRANRAYGEEFALRLLRACGVRRWHELDGVPVNVLLDGPYPRGRAIGVEQLPGDPGERFLFDDDLLPAARPHDEVLDAVGVPSPLRAPRVAPAMPR